MQFNSGDVFRVSIQYLVFDRDLTQNDLFFQVQAGGLADTDWRADWEANVRSQWLGAICNRVDIVAYKFEDVLPGTKPMSTLPPDDVGPGLNNGAQTGANDFVNSAAIISWKTPFRGQGNRGRAFISPVAADLVNEGQITGAFQILLNNAASRVVTHYNFGGPGGSPFRFILWRHHLQRVPSAVLDAQDAAAGGGAGAGEPYRNPLVVGAEHINHKPNYQYKPSDRTHPLQPRAAVFVQDWAVPTTLTSVRRRGRGVSITRSHRV